MKKVPLLLTPFVLLAASPDRAAAFAFQYTGIITSVSGSAAANGLQPGHPLTGSYTFDGPFFGYDGQTVVNVDSGCTVSQWTVSHPALAAVRTSLGEILVPGNLSFAHPDNPASFFNICDGSANAWINFHAISEPMDSVDVTLYFPIASGAFLSGDPFVNVAAFSSGNGFISGRDTTGVPYGIGYRITSAQSIPEPAAVPLLALPVLLLTRRIRTRRPHA